MGLQALAFAVMPRLPGRPLASATLKTADARSDHLPLETVAISYPWVALNTASATNILWADIDHQRWRKLLDRAIAAGLPRPAWITKSQRGAHIAWILRTPVVVRLDDLSADKRRARLLSVTLSYLQTALQADRNAALSGLAKNPWSSRWETEVGEIAAVELKDLLRPLEALAKIEEWPTPAGPKRVRPVRDPAESEKGNRLFDAVRHHAYATGEANQAALLRFAEAAAQEMGSPAPPKQVANIARSVARFMMTRWTGATRSAPLAPQAVHARQAAAGRATAAKRVEARDLTIRSAMAELRRQGSNLTKRAISELTGFSLRTLDRVWDRFEHATNAPPPSGSSSPLSAFSTSSESSVPARIRMPSSAALSGLLPPRPSRRHVLPRFFLRDLAPPLALAPLEVLADPEVTEASDQVSIPILPPATWLDTLLAAPAPAVVVDPEFLVAWRRRQRRRAKQRAAERLAWHQDASLAGLTAYRCAVNRRLMDLTRERLEALLALPRAPSLAWVASQSCDPDADVRGCFEIAEKRQRVAQGWTARIRAEARLAAITEARLLAATPHEDGINRAA